MKKKLTLFILMSLLTIQTSNLQAVLPMRWFYPLSALTVAGGIAAGGFAGYHAAHDKDNVLKKEEQKKRKTIGTTIGTALGAGFGALGIYLLYRFTPAFLIKNIRSQFGKIEGNVHQENSRLLSADWPDNEAGFNQAYGNDRFQVHDVSDEQFQNSYKQKLNLLDQQKKEIASIEMQLSSLGSDINNLEHPNSEKIKQLMLELNKRIQQAHKVLIYFDLDQIQRELRQENSQIVLGDITSQRSQSGQYADLFNTPNDQFIGAAFTIDMSDIPLYKLAIGFDRLTNKARVLKKLADKCNEITYKSPLWAQSGVMNEVQEKIHARINNVHRALKWLQSQEGFQKEYQNYQDRVETQERYNQKFSEKKRHHKSIETLEQNKLEEARKQTAEVRKQTQKLETLEREISRLKLLVHDLERTQKNDREILSREFRSGRIIR